MDSVTGVRLIGDGVVQVGERAAHDALDGGLVDVLGWCGYQGEQRADVERDQGGDLLAGMGRPSSVWWPTVNRVELSSKLARDEVSAGRRIASSWSSKIAR